ncbi:MAG TPA: hypothetical protein V6C86_15540 [Oculatellaceae cyanobacterium]
MSLRFPNARLHIHELLSAEDTRDGEALAQGARDFGLISDEHLTEITSACSDSACNCLQVGKQILVRYLETAAPAKDPKRIDSAAIWKDIEQSLKVFVTRADCGECDPGAFQTKCLKLAPALFDIILQQIGRYF